MDADIFNKPVLPSFLTVKKIALENLALAGTADWMFLLGTLAAAYLSLFLIKKFFLGNSFNLLSLTLPSFFIDVYIVLMSLPAVFWFFGTREAFRYDYFLAMQSVLVFIPAGVFLANIIFIPPVKPSGIIKNFMGGGLPRTRQDPAALPVWVLMLAFSVLVALLYIFTSSYVPLIGAITSYGKLPGKLVRPSIFLAGDFIHFSHAIAARFFLPFCLLYSYFMSHVYKGKWKRIFWAVLLFTAFFFLLTFDRSYPFSVFLLIALAVYFKIRESQNDPARPAFSRRSGLIIAASVCGLLILAMVVGGTVSLTQWNRPLDLDAVLTTSVGFIDRVFLDASFMSFVYFEQFCDPALFLHGQSLHVLISYLWGVNFYPSVSPSFVAELWFNFGWTGVILGSILIGATLQFIQLLLFRRKSIPALSIYIIMLLNGAWIIYGHLLATMVVSVYCLGILFLIFLNRAGPGTKKQGLLAGEGAAGRSINNA